MKPNTNKSETDSIGFHFPVSKNERINTEQRSTRAELEKLFQFYCLFHLSVNLASAQQQSFSRLHRREQGLLSPWFIWVPLFPPSGLGDGPTVWEVAFSSVTEVTF